MTTKEKILGLVSKEDTKTLENNRSRIANRQWLRASQEVAMKILDKLEALNWSQKDLAEKMGVSPQYINKVVKGKENLTLDTLVRLQNMLDMPVLASYYEDNIDKMEAYIMEETPVDSITFSSNYSQKTTQEIQMTYDIDFNTDSYQKVA